MEDDATPASSCALVPNRDDGAGWFAIEHLGDLDEAPSWLGDDHCDPDEMPAWLGELSAAVADSPAPEIADLLALAAATAPGPAAAELLTALSARELSADQWLSVVQLLQPIIAWLAGLEAHAIAACSGPKPPQPLSEQDAVRTVDPAALELAAALDCGQDRARDKVETARELHGTLRLTGAALEAGQIDAYRAWLIVAATADLSAEQALELEAIVLPKAAQGQPRDLKRRIGRARVKVNSAQVIKTWLDGLKGQRVEFDDGNADGLIGMHAYWTPVVALAVRKHLEQAAGGRESFDGRGKDQRLADVLAGAVLGSVPGDPTTPMSPKVRVQLTMDLPTLYGLRDNLGELKGYGPIPGDLARHLAVDAEWQRFIHDPVDGHLLDVGRVYRPDKVHDGYIKARDVVCRFPGSTRSADRAQTDHIIAFDPDGDTKSDNLQSLSPHCHRAKTFGGFIPKHLGNGVVEWTTPLGRTYLTRPHDYRPDRGDGDKATGDSGDPDPPDPD